MHGEISVFECNLCYYSWDEYESNRQYRLKKCCVCHAYICKTCFFNKNNKQKCIRCLDNYEERLKISDNAYQFSKLHLTRDACYLFRRT